MSKFIIKVLDEKPSDIQQAAAQYFRNFPAVVAPRLNTGQKHDEKAVMLL
jgi:hypothetical protein